MIFTGLYLLICWLSVDIVVANSILMATVIVDVAWLLSGTLVYFLKNR